MREWVHGIQQRRCASVPVRKITADLTRILELAPAHARPARGPFARPGSGPPLPGRVEYAGAGIVRLDDTALSSLAGLAPGEDFRVTVTDAGPVLADEYPAHEEPAGIPDSRLPGPP